MKVDIKTYMKLELHSETQLDCLLSYFYLIPIESDLIHLRFGQFIYNITGIEYKNSYNTKNPVDAYNLLVTYIKNNS